VYGYLAEQEGATYRLVAQRKFRRKTRIRARTTLRYPAGSFDGSRRWMICMPEPAPDRYGRPTETERVCGAPEIAPEPGVTTPPVARAGGRRA